MRMALILSKLSIRIGISDSFSGDCITQFMEYTTTIWNPHILVTISVTTTLVVFNCPKSSNEIESFY